MKPGDLNGNKNITFLFFDLSVCPTTRGIIIRSKYYILSFYKPPIETMTLPIETNMLCILVVMIGLAICSGRSTEGDGKYGLLQTCVY